MLHWKTFTAAPHRMMMFAGSLQLVLALLFWTAELLARYRGHSSLSITLPVSQAHGYLMLYGIFPYFVFGFLMTTYPRWMNGPLVAQSRYVASFLLMGAGSVLFYLGLFTHNVFVTAAVLLQFTGWSLGLRELYRVFRAAPAAEKTHERYLNVYLLLGAVGMLIFAFGIRSAHPLWMQSALTLGMWGFLLPLMLTVAHRMLPFFSSTVLKPYTVVQPDWFLPALPMLFAGHVACEVLALWHWRFLFDLPLAAMGLYLSVRWALLRSFEVRLLAILHLAFLWFGLGMALFAIDSLLLWCDCGLTLGRAPLHALGIGLIAGMTLAMASRVSLGHSGRPLVADSLVWLCCWGIHLSALVRIAADIPLTMQLFGLPTVLLAALIWLASVVPWTLRFAPIYLRPRVDGREG